MSWKALFGKPAGLNGAQRNDRVLNEALLEPHALLQRHHAQLNALRLECGYDASQFRDLIETPVLHVAHWVHCLPATQAVHFCEQGGLLRLCIESAAVAFRRSDGKSLADEGGDTMRDRDRERLLRYIAFLGALLRAIGACATEVQVEAPSVPTRWNPLSEGFWSWRRRIGESALVLRWAEAIDDAARRDRASVWIASRVLPSVVLEYLYDADRMLPAMLLAIVGGERASAVGTLVEEAHQAVIEQDRSKRTKHLEPQPVSVPIEHLLLDAMRMLCREKWQVNTPGAVVWCTDRGVLLEWTLASADVLIRLRASGLTNLPQDPHTLAELLLAHEVLVPNAEADIGQRHVHRIHVHARGMPKRSVDAVKIAHPARIGLHLEGVDRIAVQIDTSSERQSVQQPPLNGAPSAQLPLADPAGIALTAIDPASRRPPDQSSPSPFSPSSTEHCIESPLRRFGAVAPALQILARLLRSQQNPLATVRTEEGLVIGYPENVGLLCSKPEEFVSACEAQGLLVPERAGGRKYVRTAPMDREDLPRQYIVLAPRVLKYLGVDRHSP